MPTNPYTANRRHEEDILRNLKYKQQNSGDPSSLRSQIHYHESKLVYDKRRENDWDNRHR